MRYPSFDEEFGNPRSRKIILNDGRKVEFYPVTTFSRIVDLHKNTVDNIIDEGGLERAGIFAVDDPLTKKLWIFKDDVVKYVSLFTRTEYA